MLFCMSRCLRFPPLRCLSVDLEVPVDLGHQFGLHLFVQQPIFPFTDQESILHPITKGCDHGIVNPNPAFHHGGGKLGKQARPVGTMHLDRADSATTGR